MIAEIEFGGGRAVQPLLKHPLGVHRLVGNWLTDCPSMLLMWDDVLKAYADCFNEEADG